MNAMSPIGHRLRNVLLVDDDPIFLMMLNDFLGDQGYRCRTCIDTDAALPVIESGWPDVALLDCGLTPATELAVMHRIGALPRPIPIIIVSARTGVFHANVMRVYGARKVLEKPVSAAQVLRAIADVA